MRATLAQLNVASDITRDTHIVIKPNLTYPFHKPGVTTSPRIIRAVVEASKDYSDHITIVESDGGCNSWTADEAFAGHGIDENLCQIRHFRG